MLTAAQSDFKVHFFGKDTYRWWGVFSNLSKPTARKSRSPGVFTEVSLVPKPCSGHLFPLPTKTNLAEKNGKNQSTGLEAGNRGTNSSQHLCIDTPLGRKTAGGCCNDPGMQWCRV